MSLNDRPWRRMAAAACGVLVIALTLLISARPKGFERLFLRLAGGIIEGVSDHLGAWIAAAVVLAVASWITIAVVDLWQQRKPQ